MRGCSLVGVVWLICVPVMAGEPAPTSTLTTAPVTVSTTGFRAGMDALAGVLAGLLPDALQRGPVDEARATRLKTGIVALQQVSHALSAMPGTALPDADPTLGIVMDELVRSVDDVDHSRPDRLPQTALSLASTCIACHTRTAAPSLDVGLGPVDAALDPDVRADVFAATRRFDDARSAYRQVVFDEAFAAKEPWRWERALRRGLALEVRVKNDPKAASALVAQVLATPTAESLWPAADAWQQDLLAWRHERVDDADRGFARAARLMNLAVEQRRPGGDASAEVLFLRASAALHHALSSAKTLTPAERAQALAWLGVAYENLTDLDVWGLFLFYDAACVEALPHTPLARSCFARYERATLELFSGNSGAPLPAALGQKVEALRRKAR
jgi:hypothetical protein